MIFLSNKKLDAMMENMKALQTNNLLSSLNNINTRIFPSWTVIKEMEAYHTMDMVYAVVKKLATNSAMIPFYGFDKKSEEDLPDTDKLTIFLESLDFSEKEKLYTYLYLFGEVFMFKVKLPEGVNAGSMTVRFLHPSRVALQISKELPAEIISYRYFDIDTGEDFAIEPDDMIFIKFFNPSRVMMDEWRGLSPVKVLARTLSRVTAGEDASVAQLQNGGTPGIVFNKTPGVAAEATSARRDGFSRFLRNSSNKGAPYFAGDELGYIALGTPLTDMEVTELAGIDFDRICNAFGVSSILFNNKSASTESNVEQMVKEMYTNTILPNVYRVEGALNKYAVPDIKTKGIVKCDTSEIKSLQDDLAKLVAALKQADWLTKNEKREVMMYDQFDNPLMDEIIIDSGAMLLEDLNMVPPVDNAAGDYQAPADANKNPKVVPLKTGTNG